MDLNYIFISFMSINLGVSLSILMVLQLLKFMWRDWLTKEDIKENDRLSLVTIAYIIVNLVIIFMSV